MFRKKIKAVSSCTVCSVREGSSRIRVSTSDGSVYFVQSTKLRPGQNVRKKGLIGKI
jgi:hypothetical protein